MGRVRAKVDTSAKIPLGIVFPLEVHCVKHILGSQTYAGWTTCVPHWYLRTLPGTTSQRFVMATHCRGVRRFFSTINTVLLTMNGLQENLLTLLLDVHDCPLSIAVLEMAIHPTVSE